MTEKKSHGHQARSPEDAQPDARPVHKEHSSAQHTPLVTVVIPCYNQAHFLGEAIESVLSQSYQRYEIVVVDDGSTDNTSEVASHYPPEKVRLIRQENRGLSAARNAGLGQSRGEYVVFLDADDRLLPEALEVGVRELEAHPECAFVSGGFRYVGADGSPFTNRKQSCPDKEHYLEMLRGSYLGMHATYMYRRSIFESVGAFDTSLKFCEDSDLHLRIGRKFPVHCHDKVIAEYRLHGSTMTRNAAGMLRDSVAVFRSQRRHVEGNRRYEEALKGGVRNAQDFYGMQLVYEFRVHVREREWRQVMRDMLAMLRYYPRGFASLYEQYRFDRQLQATESRLVQLKSSVVKERQKLKQLKKQRRSVYVKVGNQPLWLRMKNTENFK